MGSVEARRHGFVTLRGIAGASSVGSDLADYLDMTGTIRITYHGLDRSSAVDAAIHDRARKLNDLFDRISSCRVVVEAPHRRHAKGNAYVVHLELHVPGDVLVVSRDHQDRANHDDLMVAIRDSFQIATRKLRHYLERLHEGNAPRKSA